MASITAFDTCTGEYDAWFDRHDDLYQAELAALKSLLPASGKGVEIGVGTGRFALPLGISIGVEPAPGMAEAARRRGVEVYEGVAEALPFDDGSFDFALMVTVVCFLDDVAGAFREAWRILRPGGVIVVGFIDRESELGHRYGHKKKRSVFYRDATFFSVSELVAILYQAGFKDFSYRQTLFSEEPSGVTVHEGYGDGSFVVIRAQKYNRECV